MIFFPNRLLKNPPPSPVILITFAFTSLSRFRRVTGNSGSASNSMIPKLPENLASGGYLSDLISSGYLFAFVSFLPASSFKESGILILNFVSSGKGPSK